MSVETNAPPSSGHIESSSSSDDGAQGQYPLTVRLLAQQAGDGIRVRAVGWTDEVDHLPLLYRFGYYRLPVGASEAAGAGTINDTGLVHGLNRDSGVEYIPLTRGFSHSPVLEGVRVSPGEDGIVALANAPDVAQAVVLSVQVRDQLGATVESMYGANGSPLVVRVLG